jgi:hypothetical protein
MINNTPNMYDHEAYRMLPPEDRWIYNKMEVAQKQGILCGPVGEPPPEGDYCIRPIMNMTGGGNPGFFRHGVGPRGLDNDPKVPGGYFWTPWVEGDRLWVNYRDDVPTKALGGVVDRDGNVPVISEVDTLPPLPEWLKDKAKFLYIEYIGHTIIEVHARWMWTGTRMSRVTNPDGSFRWDYHESNPMTE